MKEQILIRRAFTFLNRNYYISLHLIERLEELQEHPALIGAKAAIVVATAALAAQIDAANELFEVFGLSAAVVGCGSMINFLEELNTVILDMDNTMPYLSLLDYISTANAMMVKNARLAKLILDKISALDTAKYVIFKPEALQPLKDLLNNAVAHEIAN